jgi:hypothetical protein
MGNHIKLAATMRLHQGIGERPCRITDVWKKAASVAPWSLSARRKSVQRSRRRLARVALTVFSSSFLALGYPGLHPAEGKYVVPARGSDESRGFHGHQNTFADDDTVHR